MASLNFLLQFDTKALPTLGSLLQEHISEGSFNKPQEPTSQSKVEEDKKVVEEVADNKKKRNEQEQQGVTNVESATTTAQKPPPSPIKGKQPHDSPADLHIHPQSNPASTTAASRATTNNTKVGVRPPSPSYAGPSRRVGGAAPARPGSAPLKKEQIITSNASYVERWMRNLYSRQEASRGGQRPPVAGESESGMGVKATTDPSVNEIDRNIESATVRGVPGRPPSAGGRVSSAFTRARSTTPSGGEAAAGSATTSTGLNNTQGSSSSSTAQYIGQQQQHGNSSTSSVGGGSGGVYRPPRGGSASRFRSEVSGMKPLPSQTSYVLPTAVGTAMRQARHRQMMNESNSRQVAQ